MAAFDDFINARDFLLKNRDDYETAYRDFKWPVLDKFNWALDYFDTIAQGNQNLALWVVNEDGDQQKITYEEMSRRSNQTANFLRANGVKRGDRVLIMLGNEVPLWECMLASIKLGAVIIPTTTLLAEEDLQDRVDRGQIKHLIVGIANVSKFKTIGLECTHIVVGGSHEGWVTYQPSEASETFTADGETKATDPLLLYFTSGTTSKPKLVLHTHQSYPVGHLSTMYWSGLKPGDIHLNISSPGWAKHAWSCFFAPWNAGACIFIYNYSRFNSKKMLEALVHHKVTTMCAPPTVWRMMVQEDLSAYKARLSIRELFGAGEPLNPEIIEQVENGLGVTIRDGFGQTETTALIGNPPNQLLKAGSMGRPLPGYRIALLDEYGNDTDEGEVALYIEPRPIGLMQAYIDSPEKTAAVMQGGFYRTGDVAARAADGYITYVGRSDDVFKSSDYRISPFELESVLIEHPAVMEAAVVPSPDPVRLSVPKAFVILAEGYKPSRELAGEIFKFLRDNVAPYKRVRRLEFSDLPKTISGKIRRVQLRAAENERVAAKERGSMEFYEEDFKE